MSQYEQMKKDFPTMYLRVMRNDAKVRCVAAGPAVAAASGVLLDMINDGTLCRPRPEVINPEFISSEGQYDELISLGDAFLDEPAAEGSVLGDFAELAEEAGLQDVADELHEAAAKVKPRAPRKSRAKKNDPDNFPM